MDVIRLKPALKDIIWGGKRLKNEFGYDFEGDKIAEAWVISAHPSGQSRAVGGRFDGRELADILAENPRFLGEKCDKSRPFPLLVKFIDAARDLSIQVHPDDAYAAANGGGYGKTEMWYVMDAEPGAGIYFGFSRQVSPAEFSAAVADGSVCSLLNRVECKKGDVFLIPAGTVHAIGAGLLICEIQQSSDTTYRIFDYNRPGADGKPRQLHIRQASECADYTPIRPDGSPMGKAEIKSGMSVTPLTRCGYFDVKRMSCDGKGIVFCGEDSFMLAAVTEGSGRLRCGGEEIAFEKGDGLFIPAGSGSCEITGQAELVTATL